MAVFKNTSIIKKVYLVDGKPVGFINYALYIPWHRLLLAHYNCGPNARILHLAVDVKNRNLGIGSQLLEQAVNDCKAQSVNCISLCTTTGAAPQLETFYYRHGFRMLLKNRFNERQYIMRLKPHPLITITQFVLSLFKKS
jgi:GNAT superfamily N-acetyltransferase